MHSKLGGKRWINTINRTKWIEKTASVLQVQLTDMSHHFSLLPSPWWNPGGILLDSEVKRGRMILTCASLIEQCCSFNYPFAPSRTYWVLGVNGDTRSAGFVLTWIPWASQRKGYVDLPLCHGIRLIYLPHFFSLQGSINGYNLKLPLDPVYALLFFFFW